MKKKTIYIILTLVLLILVGKGAYIYLKPEKVEVIPIEPDGIEVNCEDGVGSKVRIERVFRGDGLGGYVPREFVTKGGDLYVVIKDIGPIGVLDFGTHATIRIGLSDKTWKTEEDTLVTVEAREDRYDKVTLDAGQYWFWVSNGGNIEIVSCEPENLSLVTYDE